MDRYEEMLSRYKTDLDDAQVAAAVEKIVRDNLATNSTPAVSYTHLTLPTIYSV